MSTTNIQANNSNLAYSGFWLDQSIASASERGHKGADGVVDLQFTIPSSAGTSLTLTYSATSTNAIASVTVDGAVTLLPTTVNDGAAAYHTLVLATGLTDTNGAGGTNVHNVTIVTNGQSNLFIRMSDGFVFSGDVPTMQPVPGFSTQYLFAPLADLNSTATNLSGHILGDGDVQQTNQNNCKSFFSNRPDNAIRFKTTVGTGTFSIKIWTYKIGGHLTYRVDDGAETAQATLANTSTWSYVTLASGLDSTVAHTITIYPSMINGAMQTCILYAFMLVSTGSAVAADTSATFATRSKLATYGDSLVEGYSPTPGTAPNYNADMFGHLLALQLGLPSTNTDWSVVNKGVSGSAVFAGSSNGQGRTTDITGLSPQPSKVVILYGTNDSSDTSANFQLGYWNMVNLLTTNATGTDFYCLAVPPNNSGGTLTLAQRNAIISDILTGANSDGAGHTLSAGQIAKLHYLNTSLWNLAGVSGTDFTTNYVSGSGVHFNHAGNQIITNNILPYFAASGISAAGPSTGTAGVASTAFTVTLALSATFTGSQTVTLTASNGTITATAAGGSISGNGTGTVIVTPAAGQTSFTYLYTPASAGSKTITYTNGQGWTNPSASAYSASAAPSSGVPSVSIALKLGF